MSVPWQQIIPTHQGPIPAFLLANTIKLSTWLDHSIKRWSALWTRDAMWHPGQHYFRWWIVAQRHQIITRANVNVSPHRLLVTIKNVIVSENDPINAVQNSPFVSGDPRKGPVMLIELLFDDVIIFTIILMWRLFQELPGGCLIVRIPTGPSLIETFMGPIWVRRDLGGPMLTPY